MFLREFEVTFTVYKDASGNVGISGMTNARDVIKAPTQSQAMDIVRSRYDHCKIVQCIPM